MRVFIEKYNLKYKIGDIVKIKKGCHEILVERYRQGRPYSDMAWFKIDDGFITQIYHVSFSSNLQYRVQHKRLYYDEDCLEPYDFAREIMLEIENTL